MDVLKDVSDQYLARVREHLCPEALAVVFHAETRGLAHLVIELADEYHEKPIARRKVTDLAEFNQ
jgi:hypothetical protein